MGAGSATAIEEAVRKLIGQKVDSIILIFQVPINLMFPNQRLATWRHEITAQGHQILSVYEGD
jgi:hypothetical protein